MHHLRKLIFFVVAAGIIGSLAPSTEARSLLRPGTRSTVYQGGVGVGVTFGYGVSFVLHNNISYHFSGKSHGPALGADLDLTLGTAGALVIAPRFNWDIQVGSKAIYISPFIRMGLHVNFDYGAGFDLQFGARVKFILNNRALLFFQPLALELVANKYGTFGSYQFLFGYGATF